jgi:hypothetical protein
VNPRCLLDTAVVPGGEGTRRLMQRGPEFSIRLVHYELTVVAAGPGLLEPELRDLGRLSRGRAHKSQSRNSPPVNATWPGFCTACLASRVSADSLPPFDTSSWSTAGPHRDAYRIRPNLPWQRAHLCMASTHSLRDEGRDARAWSALHQLRCCVCVLLAMYVAAEPVHASAKYQVVRL